MKSGYQTVEYATAAEIASGRADDKRGVRIIVVDTGGQPTGEVREGQSGAPSVVQTAANQILDNFAATTAPTASNDSAQGYAVGSRWVDTASGESYICLSASAAAAVWSRITVGTIAEVAGLQAVLDAKAAVSHAHVKSEVGLGNVDNTSDAAKPISTAVQTALGAKQDAATAATDAELAAHATNTANVHAVTKAQVGLGSVDNTADSAKPVSTATQTALNAKVTIWDATTTETITGRRIGGLDVYARRVTGTAPASGVDLALFTPSTGAASRLIGFDGWINRSGAGQRQPLITVVPDTALGHASPVYQTSATGAINMYLVNSAYNGQAFDITVFYTK